MKLLEIIFPIFNQSRICCNERMMGLKIIWVSFGGGKRALKMLTINYQLYVIISITVWYMHNFGVKILIFYVRLCNQKVRMRQKRRWYTVTSMQLVDSQQSWLLSRFLSSQVSFYFLSLSISLIPILVYGWSVSLSSMSN